MVFIIHFFVGSIEVSIPVIANLLPGKGPVNMGYIQTAFGGGAVIMALLLSYVSITNRESFMLFVAVAFIGLFLFLIGLSGFVTAHILICCLLFLLFSSSIILAGTSFQSLIQKNTASEMTGRVFGVVSSVGNFSIPFAMLLYGFLLEYFNTYLLLGVSGLMIILITVLSSLVYMKKGDSPLIAWKNRKGSHFISSLYVRLVFIETALLQIAPHVVYEKYSPIFHRKASRRLSYPVLFKVRNKELWLHLEMPWLWKPPVRAICGLKGIILLGFQNRKAPGE